MIMRRIISSFLSIPNSSTSNPTQTRRRLNFIGTALATGSDDCTIRIWETLGLGDHSSNPEFVSMHRGNSSKAGTGSVIEPAKTFRTRKTSILDLQYTKRNLILSVGKYFNQ